VLWAWAFCIPFSMVLGREFGRKSHIDIYYVMVSFSFYSCPGSKLCSGAWGVGQVVEHLLSKHEALSSNPNTEKKKSINQSYALIMNWESLHLFSILWES
jgi:hypothetical protein